MSGLWFVGLDVAAQVIAWDIHSGIRNVVVHPAPNMSISTACDELLWSDMAVHEQEERSSGLGETICETYTVRGVDNR